MQEKLEKYNFSFGIFKKKFEMNQLMSNPVIPTVKFFTKVCLFLGGSCAIFSWLNFMVMLCYDWVYYDYKFESTENRAIAI